MKDELIGPTATLAAAILGRYNGTTAEIPNDVIASAFQQAHTALRMAIAQVDEEEELRKKAALSKSLSAMAKAVNGR